jgi:hypothetical protein
MDFLFFASANHQVTRRLQEMVEAVVPEENRATYRDIRALSRRLCEPAKGERIVLLSASSQQDLSLIQSIRSLLSDESIIIVLPDREADTIAMGHSLHPRFLTYKDSDFTELAGVLVKMLTAPAFGGTSQKSRR